MSNDRSSNNNNKDNNVRLSDEFHHESQAYSLSGDQLTHTREDIRAGLNSNDQSRNAKSASSGTDRSKEGLRSGDEKRQGV